MKPSLPLIAALLVSADVPAQGPYLITLATIGPGGATSASGVAYTVGGTLGQPVVGAGTGGSFGLAAGFWAGSSPSPCYPDCNTDGALTVSDFGCFQTAFVIGDPYADCNADGILSVADFGCFQTLFVVGCP